MNRIQNIEIAQDKRISIIIPVYRTEKYLEKCIESVVSQTYRNLEIILVDDGSPDSCGQICDNWKLRDSRIQVIHKSNGGLSDARNAGIDAASGEFIAFIDSDDFIQDNYIDRLYSLCRKYNAQVAICDILSLSLENINDHIREENKAVEKIYNGTEALKEMFTEGQYQKIIVACNKLYDIRLFEEIRYPIGKINEDGFTTHQLLYKTKRVVSTNEKLYVYVLTPGSITRSPYSLKHLDDIEGFEIRNEFFLKNKEYELYRLSLSWYLLTLRFHYYSCRYYYPEKYDIYLAIWKKFCIAFAEAFYYKEMPLRRKISLLVTYLFRDAYFRKFMKGNTLKYKKINQITS